MIENHIISTGADGRLAGMSAEQVRTMVDAALQGDRLVVHFHGGLVNEAGGRGVAERLLPVYESAGAHPIFFQWRSGPGEIVRHNLLEIAREEIFERLTRKVLAWAVGRVRDGEDGARAGAGGARPSEEELNDELGARKRKTDPDAGQEPFANEPMAAEELELTRAEEAAFLSEVENDTTLKAQLAGVVAERQIAWHEQEGGRGIPEATPVVSAMDQDVVAEIAEGNVEDARGPFSTVALARKALQVLKAVLGRYRGQTDSGIYPTVVEEVLRAFYLANVGGALWQAMKQETEDAFEPDGDRGARVFLDHLAKSLADQKVTLVGHSTGAVFIDHLLTEVVRGRTDGDRDWPQGAAFQVVFLAPAATTQHFAAAVASAGDLIGRFRMFTMDDVTERRDRVAGAVYPRSLLYLVSGLLEREGRDSAVTPLVGLERYLGDNLDRLLTSDLARTARLAEVRTYLAEADRVVRSKSKADAEEGFRAGAERHGAFDDDDLVRTSMVSLISSW